MAEFRPDAGRGTLSENAMRVDYTGAWSWDDVSDAWRTDYGRSEYTLRLARPPQDVDAAEFLDLQVLLHLAPGTQVWVGEKEISEDDLPLDVRQPLTFGQGEQALILQPPAIYEEENPQQRVEGEYQLTAGPDPSTFALHVRLPWAWVTAEERQYPLVLDPIFQMRSPTQVLAARYDANGNFLSYVNIENEQLALGSFANGAYRVLMHFSPPTMPQGTHVDKAYLMVAPTGINRDDLNYVGRHVEAHVLTDWPTGSAAPTFSSATLPTVESSDFLIFSRGLDAYDRIGWDVTNLLQNWLTSNNADAPGILLKLADSEENCSGSDCSGFFIPYPSQFTNEDLRRFQIYFDANTLPPLLERGGIALVTIYSGPQLIEGSPIPTGNPFYTNFGNPTPSGDIYYHASHDYQVNVGNHWQAVVARGLGDSFGPEPPQEGDPLGLGLLGSVPLTLSDSSVQSRPRDANDSTWAQSGHLGYALFNGRRLDGQSYHIGVAAQTGEGEKPKTYDIRLVGERETLSVGPNQTQRRVVEVPSGDPLTLWNLNLPPNSNARVDVRILGYNTPAGTNPSNLYDNARHFSGKLFPGDQSRPQGAGDAGIKLGNNALSRSSLDYGSVRLTSGIFQPETGNFGLALTYDGPQINFYKPQAPPKSMEPDTASDDEGPTDLVFRVEVRVTACGAGTFPTSSGNCQRISCPSTSFNASNRKTVAGMQVWSPGGWDGSFTRDGDAPLIGPPGDTAPTVAVVGGTVDVSNDHIVVQADSVMLVDCGSLSYPPNPVTNIFDVYDNGKMSSVGGNERLLSDGPGIQVLDPWPDADKKDVGFAGFWVAPLIGRAEGGGILLRHLGSQTLTFLVNYGVDVNGWPSLTSSVERLAEDEPPPVAGLDLALGDTFSMDVTPAGKKVETRYFRAVRARAATITQPNNLGGASKPVQALILPNGVPIPANEPITCADNCLDLRNATQDTPDHPDRTWEMPDIHTTGQAGTVIYSKAGELVVYSKDHPLAAHSGQDFSQEFSFDTFDAGVSVTKGQCLGTGPIVTVITGQTHITLPNVGDSSDSEAQLLAEFTLCESTPGAGDTSLRGVHLQFKSPVGIPVDGSGLFVTNLEGKVDIFPNYTTIQLDMDLQAAKGGDGGLFKGHGTVTIDTRGLFDLQGTGKLLGVVGVTGELFVAWNPMDIAMDMSIKYEDWLAGSAHIHVWQGQGWQHRYPWLPDNDEKHFAAQFSATLTIHQGDVFRWWFIDIPPVDMDFTVEVAFGQFCTNASCTTYEWGVKGAFSVEGYYVGVYYGFDKGFDFILGNDGHRLIDQYGGSLAALDADDPNRVMVEAAAPVVDGVSEERLTVTPNTENLLVALGWQGGSPQLKLLDPDGVDVTARPNFYTVSINQTAHSLLMGVQLKQPRPGQWRARISNISGREHYKFIYFANKGAPGTMTNRGRFLAPTSNEEPGNGSYTLRWEVPPGTPATSTISLFYTRYYLADGILWRPNPDWAIDTPIVQNLPFNRGSYVWDTSGLINGHYKVRAVVHDGINDLPDVTYSPDDPCQARNELPPARAFDPNRFPGVSTFTSTGMILIDDTTPPAAPTGLDLYAVDGAILARWDLGPEKDLSAYIVRWGNRFYNPFTGSWSWLSYNEMRVSASEEPHARLGGLTNDQAYSVMVRAVDASLNEGANSEVLEATPTASRTLPDAPTGFTLISVDSHSASFQWSPPAAALSGDWHPPSTGYRLHYRKMGEDSEHDLLTTSTSATLSGLETGATYLVWVGQLVHAAVNSGDPGWEGAVTNPLRVVVTNGVDANGNGLPDDWEQAHNFPSGSVAADLDHDGLSNMDEFQTGTDPTNPDSDGDGFSDGEEVVASTDPLSGLSYGAEHTIPRLEIKETHLVFHAQVGQRVPPREIHLAEKDGAVPLQGRSNESWLWGQFVPTTHGGRKFLVGVDTQGLQPGFYSGVVRLLPRPETEPLLGDQCIRVDLWLSPGEVYLPLVAAP